MTKAEIRELISDRKKSFQTLEKMSLAVIKKFQRLELFQQAKTVGAYMPLPDEVDITPLFSFDSFVAQDRQLQEKTFYIPAFNETSGGYQLAQLSEKLKTGKFGIPEPANPDFAPKKLDLIIVPGVAFDRAGNRIGRGGGFYDQLLPKYHAARVGVCFDFQCLPVLSDEGVEVEEIPTEPHDCKVDWLVAESEILNFAMNS